MKKAVIGSLLVVGLLSGYAFAHGSGYGHMGGNGYGMMGQFDQDDQSPMWRGGHHMMGNYRGMHHGGMMYQNCPGANWNQGNGNARLSDDQYQSFLDATASLRKEMHNKRFDLMEAQRNPDTTPSQIAEIEKQIVDIRAKIDEKALSYQKSE